MTRAKNLIKYATTSLVAITALAASALPAAAGNLGITFQFGTPNFQVHGTNRPVIVEQYQPQVSQCLTNRQIIRGMNDLGYRNVQYEHEQSYGRPVFSYWSSGWTYRAAVDRCTGQLTPLPQPQHNVRVQPHVVHVPAPHHGAVIYQIR